LGESILVYGTVLYMSQYNIRYNMYNILYVHQSYTGIYVNDIQNDRKNKYNI